MPEEACRRGCAQRKVLIMYGTTYLDLQTTPRAVAWRMLRALRHSPPGRATKGVRSRVFNSALEQSEQLFKAAESVGPQSRPLLVFYGLSQAARALSAASANVSNDDFKLYAHGIKVPNLSAAVNAPIADLTVAPQSGSFNQLANILKSSNFAPQVRLGDLWGVLPGNERFPVAGQAGAAPLSVSRSIGPGSHLYVQVQPLPASLQHSIPTGAVASRGQEAGWLAERERVVAYLAPYPTLSGFEFLNPTGPASLHLIGDNRLSVPIRWPIKPGESADSAMSHHTTPYRSEDLAFPAIGSDERPVHPILAWWALLYGLSMLARYEPDAWAGYIQVNGSADAVPIEALLEDSINVLPELIHQVIISVAGP